jgi:hypothetical protein
MSSTNGRGKEVSVLNLVRFLEGIGHNSGESDWICEYLTGGGWLVGTMACLLGLVISEWSKFDSCGRDRGR